MALRGIWGILGAIYSYRDNGGSAKGSQKSTQRAEISDVEFAMYRIERANTDGNLNDSGDRVAGMKENRSPQAGGSRNALNQILRGPNRDR